MFYTVISKETFDAVMSLFFRNLGLIDPSTDIQVTDLVMRGDEVQIEGDINMETIN